MSTATGRHSQGLAIASKYMGLSSKIRNKVMRIEFAYNLVRHITGPSVSDFIAQVHREIQHPGEVQSSGGTAIHRFSSSSGPLSCDSDDMHLQMEQPLAAPSGVDQKIVDIKSLIMDLRADVLTHLGEAVALCKMQISGVTVEQQLQAVSKQLNSQADNFTEVSSALAKISLDTRSQESERKASLHKLTEECAQSQATVVELARQLQGEREQLQHNAIQCSAAQAAIA